MVRMSSFIIPLLSLLLPSAHSVQFSHFPVTVGRADCLLDQLGSVRPTGRPGVPSGEQALLALLDSGDYTTEGSSKEFTTEGSARDFTTKGSSKDFTTEGSARNSTTEGSARKITTEESVSGFTDGYALFMSVSGEDQDRSTGRDDRDELRYSDSQERPNDKDVSKNHADQVRSRYGDLNASSVNTVGQIKSNSINNNIPSLSKHSVGLPRSNIRGRSRNGNDFVRSQNVVGRKKSRVDVRSRKGNNHLRKSHKQVNTRRHGEQEIPKNKDDPEIVRYDGMHAKTISKSRLSSEKIPHDLRQYVLKLADHGFRYTETSEPTTIDSRLQNRSFQNIGRKGQAKPSKTLNISELKQSVPLPELPIEREISKPGKIIATSDEELLKQGIRVFNTNGLNQKSRNNSDRMKGNEKGRSFNKKHKQSRKKERNIRIRVQTTKSIPAKKDGNESKSSDGNGVIKSLSTNPSNHVRTDPLLRILKKTNTKNIKDKFFVPTAPPKIEFSRHDKEVLMYPSVRKDPVVRILKAEQTKGKQDKSFSTTAKPKKIEKQRASIRYRYGNNEAQILLQSQIQTEKSKDTHNYNRSRSSARQESKTKRRKQQNKKVPDTAFIARNENNMRKNNVLQKETIGKQSLQPNGRVNSSSGEKKIIERRRFRGRTRVYDVQIETKTEYSGERLDLISKEPKSENLLQNKARDNQELDVGHATESNDKFSSTNTKTRERVQNKDDTIEGNDDPHYNDIEIDLTQFRSNEDETEMTQTEAEFAEVPSYDIEKALKHAKITLAQDPFRKEGSLSGKPTFDIDFSKNPAEHKNHNPIKTVNIPNEIRNARKSVIVKGAANSIQKLSYSDENSNIENKPIANESSVHNPWGKNSRTIPKNDRKKDEAPTERLVSENHNLDSLTDAKEDNEFSIEDLTWTPALLRRKVDPRQPRQIGI